MKKYKNYVIQQKNESEDDECGVYRIPCRPYGYGGNFENSKCRIKVFATGQVLDKAGRVKVLPPWRHFFQGTPGGQLMEQRLHNIVVQPHWTILSAEKFLNDTGYVQAGTGWMRKRIKTNTRCTIPAGSMQGMDDGYPIWEWTLGIRKGTTIIYRATFPAGFLVDNNINEVCLLNGSSEAADCLAYARLVPAMNVTFSVLRIVWEINIIH
jgi:hypothetical protein